MRKPTIGTPVKLSLSETPTKHVKSHLHHIKGDGAESAGNRS
jgi:hypothetical protein